MRVIIVGASKVGEVVTKYLCNEGHDVVVIDNEAGRINNITDKFDCNGFVGNGTSSELLKKAGIDSAKMLIAVTKNDETNILSCAVAKQLGIERTIAAVRGAEYKNEREFIKSMGVSSIINPERLAALEIQNMLRYPSGVDIERFGDGNVVVASIDIKKGNMLVDTKLADLNKKVGCDVLICSIKRGSKSISPNGDTVINAGDRITVIAIGENMDNFLNSIGIIEKPIKKVLIIGGGKVGRYLTEIMLESGIKVELIDNNSEVCEQLIEKYPKATILCGDGTDTELLSKQLKGKDGCITVTGSDDINLVISMFAKSCGVERISAEIDNDNYAGMIRKSGVSHIFSTQDISMAGILRNVRDTSKQDDVDGNIKWMYTMDDGNVEAVEFEVSDKFKYCGKKLMDKDFKLKDNVLIATIINKDGTSIARGASTIESNDKIIVVSVGTKLSKLSDIYA